MVSISIFQDKEVFFGLSDEQLAEIALVADRKRYKPGEVLFNEGTTGDALFIIESGEVDLTVKKGEADMPSEVEFYSSNGKNLNAQTGNMPGRGFLF